MKRALAAVVLAAALPASCTNTPRLVEGTPSPSPSASPQTSPSPSPSPPPRFETARLLAHARMLSERIGAREATTAAFAAAAEYTAKIFASFGYRVVRQRVRLPAGTTEGVSVPAGFSQNVVAYPPGYDPARRHLVVGGHLDTVPSSPGANDNGSGAALVLELARLSSLAPPRLPVVFVQFTAEERRLKGSQGAMYGSRAYVASLRRAELRSIAGMMNVDMIGNGPVTLVCRRSSTSSRTFLDATLGTARRLKVAARESIVTRFFSDAVPFESAGIPVSWLWTGEHPSVHTPRDRMNVVRASDVERTGRIAWETLRFYR